MNGQPKFGRVRSKLSQKAIDFTMLCLDKDPYKRATAIELLNHPFITDNVASTQIDQQTALEIAKDLTSFYKQSVFQSGIVSFITGISVQQSELENLKRMFLTLDSS